MTAIYAWTRMARRFGTTPSTSRQSQPHGCDGVLRHERRRQSRELLGCQSDAGTLEYNAQNGKIIWQNNSDHCATGDGRLHPGRFQDAPGGHQWKTYVNGLSAQLYCSTIRGANGKVGRRIRWAGHELCAWRLFGTGSGHISGTGSSWSRMATRPLLRGRRTHVRL